MPSGLGNTLDNLALLIAHARRLHDRGDVEAAEATLVAVHDASAGYQIPPLGDTADALELLSWP